MCEVALLRQIGIQNFFLFLNLEEAFFGELSTESQSKYFAEFILAVLEIPLKYDKKDPREITGLLIEKLYKWQKYSC